MLKRNLAIIGLSILLASNAFAWDFGQYVSEDSSIPDVLGSETGTSADEYITGVRPVEDVLGKADSPKEEEIKKLSAQEEEKKSLDDFGYVVPGTMEVRSSYEELDRQKLTRNLRKNSKAAFNLTYIHNGYDYQSNNDVINQTISNGYKSLKGGNLLLRNDSYVYKSDFINFHWSLGFGIGYSTGRGIFVNGDRSDARFNFWEAPIDLGVGLELPIASWFKITGTVGPSVKVLMQNRSDFDSHEEGKRKFQYSPGYFGSAQFKINLYALSDKSAHDLFVSSDITGIYLNIEARHENYEKFQDSISISGTSIGAGFTFEYL